MVRAQKNTRRPLPAIVGLLFLLVFFPGLLLAQEQDGTAKEALRSLFQEGAAAVGYTEAFANAISPSQIDGIVASLRDRLGAFHAVEGEESPFTLRFANGTAEAQIVVDSGGAIAGLRFTSVTAATGSLEEAVQELLALPGNVSVAILRNGVELAGHRSQEPMVVGSAFKLAVLRAAEVAVQDQRTRWDQVLQLSDSERSLPSGITQEWPDGSYLTLDSAAILMVSLSDNSATDLIIDHLGRRRVEQYAPNSRPLLTTREFFLLKSPEQDALRERYLGASPQERRQILESGVEGTLPGESLFAGGPVHPEIEWFFTTRELANLIRSTARRDILAVSSGPFNPRDWEYLGYKGGSEPGVLNMTLLLVAKDGTEYAISATQNRSDAAIDPNPFVSALNSILFHLR